MEPPEERKDMDEVNELMMILRKALGLWIGEMKASKLERQKQQQRVKRIEEQQKEDAENRLVEETIQVQFEFPWEFQDENA